MMKLEQFNPMRLPTGSDYIYGATYSLPLTMMSITNFMQWWYHFISHTQPQFSRTFSPTDEQSEKYVIPKVNGVVKTALM